MSSRAYYPSQTSVTTARHVLSFSLCNYWPNSLKATNVRLQRVWGRVRLAAMSVEYVLEYLSMWINLSSVYFMLTSSATQMWEQKGRSKCLDFYKTSRDLEFLTEEWHSNIFKLSKSSSSSPAVLSLVKHIKQNCRVLTGSYTNCIIGAESICSGVKENGNSH